MHLHVTGFSAATILVFAIASPSRAQGIEVFGGYSVNADYVQNRPAILVVDQKVSPFFSLGSGPAGFEASFKQDVRNGLGAERNNGRPATGRRSRLTTRRATADTARGAHTLRSPRAQRAASGPLAAPESP